MKKYELTGGFKLHFGIKLWRIKALVDIEGVCKIGDLGGYVQSENNLDQSGNAWVSGEAQVYGNAWETSPLYIQGTKCAAYMCDSRRFAVGCQKYTFAGWHKFWRKIAANNGFTEAEQKEYIMYFNLACERYGKTEYKVSFEDESGNEDIDEDV